MKRILSLIVLVAIVFTFSGCRLFNRDGKESVQEYALVVTDPLQLSVLDDYPNLQYVDFRGSTCVDAVLDYTEAHPDIDVRFSVGLGQQYVNQDVEKILLRGDEADFDELMSNLKLLRRVTSVHISQIGFTKAQLDQLKAAYPQIAFTYSVILGDESFDTAVTQVNISQIGSEEVETALSALGHLPNLTQVDLVDADGKTTLTAADCKVLMDAYPQIQFNCQFNLFGQTLDQDTTSVTYHDIKIDVEGLEQIGQALELLPNCTYVSFDNCGIDSEVLSQFRSEHPDITVAWRIFVDDYSVFTDTEVILMPNIASNSDTDPLKYCTNVKYLDLTGCKSRDFDFLESMTNLECAVLSKTFLSDLSVLSNSSNLTWLELINCTALKDVTPLSGLSNLKYLNLSLTKVREISVLDDAPLERLKCVKSSISAEELSDFSARHPGCMVSNTGSAVGMGWRYDDGSQRVPFSYYSKMMEAFGYEK